MIRHDTIFSKYCQLLCEKFLNFGLITKKAVCVLCIMTVSERACFFHDTYSVLKLFPFFRNCRHPGCHFNTQQMPVAYDFAHIFHSQAVIFTAGTVACRRYLVVPMLFQKLIRRVRTVQIVIRILLLKTSVVPVAEQNIL